MKKNCPYIDYLLSNHPNKIKFNSGGIKCFRGCRMYIQSEPTPSKVFEYCTLKVIDDYNYKEQNNNVMKYREISKYLGYNSNQGSHNVIQNKKIITKLEKRLKSWNI